MFPCAFVCVVRLTISKGGVNVMGQTHRPEKVCAVCISCKYIIAADTCVLEPLCVSLAMYVCVCVRLGVLGESVCVCVCVYIRQQT
jgi:hypothetical protein